MSTKTWQYVVTTTYKIHANDDGAADAGLAWVLEHGEFGDNVTVTDQVVARFDPPREVPGDAWFWNDDKCEWELANDN